MDILMHIGMTDKVTIDRHSQKPNSIGGYIKTDGVSIFVSHEHHVEIQQLATELAAMAKAEEEAQAARSPSEIGTSN